MTLKSVAGPLRLSVGSVRNTHADETVQKGTYFFLLEFCSATCDSDLDTVYSLPCHRQDL